MRYVVNEVIDGVSMFVDEYADEEGAVNYANALFETDNAANIKISHYTVTDGSSGREIFSVRNDCEDSYE